MPTRYLCDLTTDEWDRVRAAVFAPDLTPDALRRIIDGLLFRERAWCPWSLIPADFPAVDELRAHARRWSADGTWERIRAAMRPPAAPPPDPRSGLRRRVAGVVRRLPGGGAVLLPGRLLIRLAQDVRRRRTPAARLPAVFRAAHDRLSAGDPAAAVGLFTQVLDLDPANGEAWVDRGQAHESLGRSDLARDDLLTALSAPDLRLGLRARANLGLGRAYLRLGAPDRAVGHAFLAKLVARFGADAPWAQDALAEEADEFELLAEAHTDVAEWAISTASDFATADALYARRDGIHRQYRHWLATLPGETVYLAADWVRNIGHTALIDSWLKMRLLGWVSASRVVLHAPPQATANRAYVGCFRPLLKVIADPGPGGATRHLTAALGQRVASFVRLPTGERRYFLDAMGVVQEEWERQGRPPLLALTDEDREHGRAVLRAMGVPDGAWFVSLHVRSSGFHEREAATAQAYRNADVASYLPLIREVVGRGGWVVRVGDTSMPPLPRADGAVDYATGPHKSDRMDVFLCAACRFFVGGPSGLIHVPTTFGVPCLATNWVSNVLPVYGRHDLFVPKRIHSDGAGRVLTFDEWLDPGNRDRYVIGTEMAGGGLRVIDNTAEELREAVAEMLDRLDGKAVYGPEDDRRRERFGDVARRHGLAGFARIGRDFLRRYESLLPNSAGAQ
jgi:putative glycosyltransferase (TIGR04372 family)